MIHRLSFLIALFACVAPATPLHADAPKIVPLWDGPALGAKGRGPAHTPGLYVYPAERPNGAAVLVLPGGGYSVHAIDHEGVQVARRLNRAGVTAFVLTYRLRPAGYTEHDAFVDGRRAVRLVRARAKDFGIDPRRVGVLGFSAGGHLATALGVNFDGGQADAEDPVERASSRPDFMVVCYTVPAPLDRKKGREDGWKEVTKDTPPAFLWVTHQDADRPVETAKFYQMLQQAGVDAELHVFGGWGPHGLGLAPGEPGVGAWPDLLETWLRRRGLLTGKPRVAVSGTVTVDGEPLHRGWVTLLPLDEAGAPPAAAYVTEKAGGRFAIPAEYGPVTGRYRVVVYRVARQFLPTPSLDNAEHWTADPNGSELTVAITGQVNDFAFHLSARE